MLFLREYTITFIVFFVIDLIWLTLIARNLYQQEIGSILKTDVNWIAAIIFYLIFVLGLVVFVVNPSITANSIGKAMLYGALFGFITYATYDLTNLATLEGFTLKIAIIDIIWGTVLGFSTSLIAFLLHQWLF